MDSVPQSPSCLLIFWHEVNNRSYFDVFPSAQPLAGETFKQALRGTAQSTGEESWRPRPESTLEWNRWHAAPWRQGGEGFDGGLRAWKLFMVECQ